MAINVQQPQQPAKRGFGGLGKLLGIAGAGAAAIATGGLSIPATIGLLGTGASVGGAIGDAIKPGQAGGPGQGVQSSEDSAITRRVKSGESQAQMEQLKQSALATAELPPEQRRQYLEPIMNAAAILKQQQGGGVA